MRRRARFFAVILALAAIMPGLPASAETPVGDGADEITVGHFVFRGALAGKEIEARLHLFDTTAWGDYCYKPCTSGDRLDLHGLLSNDVFELDETLLPADPNKAKVITAHWSVRLTPARLEGEWRSADGKRRYPLRLTNLAPWPFELSLVAEVQGDDPRDDGDVSVSAIRVYRGGKLAQTLRAESIGKRSFVVPQVADFNFDGYPDIALALLRNAGPNVAYGLWLFNPATKHFESAKVGELTSPQIDAAHKCLYSFMSGGAASHAVDVYAWKGSRLERIKHAESYVKKVQRPGREPLECYMVPKYDLASGEILWDSADNAECREDPGTHAR